MACRFPILCIAIINFYIFSQLGLSKNLESDNSDCKDRWIYIRKLPQNFNLDLLKKCSEYPIYDNFCPHLANHGLGQKTHNNSQSWYRTDPYMLELIFHRRILEYPCLTSDYSSANAIFLPYYAGLDALKYLYGPEGNSSFNHGMELFNFLQEDEPEIWRRNMAHDHFLVMARPAGDFSQPLTNDPPIWGTSFLELPEFFNVTCLTLEGRAWPWQDQAIPYPTSFHPHNLNLLDTWFQRVRKSRRNTLMLFAGDSGIANNPNVRRSVRDECENSTANGNSYNGYESICEIVDCLNRVCEHDPIRFMKPMLRSTFCLQPPGDTPSRRSTFDGIVAGCIPVFFEELSAKRQFGWHLPEGQYEEFSVFIQEKDVVGNGLKIVDVLKSISIAEVRRMRENVMKLIPKVIYRRHESSLGLRSKKDAFDIAVESTIQRIKSRLTEISAQ
ncbi:Exostosin, GT47 domain [Dillenia turbinata]|uniref:Exostosin, GT47 domain n=1 Tax=Dillenia turbinata TaxID=194707 RepID=A0AAN8VSW2_9MAGN